MATVAEMTIPRDRYHVAGAWLAVCFVILAVVNLVNRVAIIASVIWLGLVIYVIFAVWKEGSSRSSWIEFLGNLVGSNFVRTTPCDAKPAGICFGYKLFGHRFNLHSVPVESIESVQWDTGQFTAMAGHDVNDWIVWLWFDHHDAARSAMGRERRSRVRKPDQDLLQVGPPRRKEVTDALGHSFVAFLQTAGAKLVPGDEANCFVRSTTATVEAH